MTDSESLEEAYADADDVWARETAPQSPYTTQQVGIGLAVFAVLALVAFGVPLVL